jgi:hypothetical protein
MSFAERAVIKLERQAHPKETCGSEPAELAEAQPSRCDSGLNQLRRGEISPLL